MTHYRARVMPDKSLRILSNEPPALTAGEIVIMEIHHSRSERSHKHQFAWLKDAWASLPEHWQGVPWAETPETMRKHALIASGYFRTYTIDCGSAAAAQRMRSALISAEWKAEGYAVGQLKGPILTVWTAKSQNTRAMTGKEFQESKEAVLNWVAEKLGTTPEDLRKLSQ